MMRKFVIVHEGSLPININGRVSGSFLSPIALSTIQLSTLVAYDISVYEIDPNDETNRIKITSENINCSPFKKVKNKKRVKPFTVLKINTIEGPNYKMKKKINKNTNKKSPIKKVITSDFN